MAQHHRLHLRVWGRAVPFEERWSPGGLTIEVERFEQLWPEEHVEGFLGHIDMETVKGREVAIFTEHERGQRYVLAQSLEPGEQTRLAAAPGSSASGCREGRGEKVPMDD